MLQEFHTWSPERQKRWRETRKKGCLSYVLKVAAMAFVGAAAISVVYLGLNWEGDRSFHLSTAMTLSVSGALSGLIVGRTKWVLSESTYKEQRTRPHLLR